MLSGGDILYTAMHFLQTATPEKRKSPFQKTTLYLLKQQVKSEKFLLFRLS